MFYTLYMDTYSKLCTYKIYIVTLGNVHANIVFCEEHKTVYGEAEVYNTLRFTTQSWILSKRELEHLNVHQIVLVHRNISSG